MAETLNNSAVKITVSTGLSSDIDLGSRGYSLNYNGSHTYSNGTGANQANMVWSDTRTLAASGTENLDLAGGLTNAFGTTITFTKIKEIIIVAASGNTNNVLVGGHATLAFATWVSSPTDIIVIRPGGYFALGATDATAYAVTAATGDLLTIANSGGTTGVTYDIILVGVV